VSGLFARKDRGIQLESSRDALELWISELADYILKEAPFGPFK
jgi:hypothetical protein